MQICVVDKCIFQFGEFGLETQGPHWLGVPSTSHGFCWLTPWRNLQNINYTWFEGDHYSTKSKLHVTEYMTLSVKSWFESISAFTQWHAIDRVATTVAANNWKLCPADVVNGLLIVVPGLSPSSATVPQAVHWSIPVPTRQNRLLVGGWATPLKNISHWDDYSQYMGK